MKKSVSSASATSAHAIRCVNTTNYILPRLRTKSREGAFSCAGPQTWKARGIGKHSPSDQSKLIQATTVLLLRLAISYSVIPPSHPTALSNEGQTASQQFSRTDIYLLPHAPVDSFTMHPHRLTTIAILYSHLFFCLLVMLN